MATFSAWPCQRQTALLASCLLTFMLVLLSWCSCDAFAPEQRKAFVNNLRMIADQRAPYVWGGNDVQKGLDCSHYMFQAARYTGFSVSYEVAARMADGFGNWLGFTLADKLRHAQPGDLLFYNWGSSRIKHVGAAARDPQTGDPSIYHASSSRNQVVRVPLMGVLAKPSRVRDIFRDPLPKSGALK